MVFLWLYKTSSVACLSLRSLIPFRSGKAIMRYIILLTLSISALAGYSQIKISKEKGVDISKYQTFVVQKGQIISSSNEQGVNEQKFFNAIREVITREMTL